MARTLPLLTGWLNNLKVSPLISVGPILLTVNVPAPVLVKICVPEILTKSFDAASDLFNLKYKLPDSVTLLAIVNVPIVATVLVPGAKVPPAWTTTGRLIAPMPPRLPPLATISYAAFAPAVPRMPFTNNVPLLTVTAFVYEFVAERINGEVAL